ncbi:hypothetical protein Ahy_A10g046841 isoform D [Arachis hypogaea]|nr:hypothetical protein Ahy_A10g046841 isoform D [Arachis hypogaea]
MGNVYLWTYVYNIVRVSTRGTSNCNNAANDHNDSPRKYSEPELLSCSEPLLVSNKNVKDQYVLLPCTTSEATHEVAGTANMSKRLQLFLRKASLKEAFAPSTIGAVWNLTVVRFVTGLKGSEIDKSIIIGIIISRYIILPVSGIFIIKWAVQLGMVQLDPLYQFVLLIQYAVPPSMNIGAITQLFGIGEKECSVILLWSYLVASISLTFWSTYFMWLVS